MLREASGPTSATCGQGRAVKTGAFLITSGPRTLPMSRFRAVITTIDPRRQETILPSTKTSWPSSIGMS
jgi:hypothetical protein